MNQTNSKFSKVKSLKKELFDQLTVYNVSDYHDLSARLYNCAQMPSILPTQVEHLYKTTFSGNTQDIHFDETDFTKRNGLPYGYLNIKVFNNKPAFEFLGGWTTKGRYYPIFIIVYLDEMKNVRLYIPKNGNAISALTQKPYMYTSHPIAINNNGDYCYNIDDMRLDICEYFNLTKEWMYPE